MKRLKQIVTSRFITGILHFSIASVAVISQMNIASAQAGWAEKEDSAFESISGLPLLADSRRENRGFDKGHNRQRSKNPRKFYSNEVKKSDRKKIKNRNHHDYRQRDFSGKHKHKVWRSKEKNRRHFTPQHERHYISPAWTYPRHHPHRDRVVVRPFRHHYPRYRNHYYNNDAWGWLAFTAITLTILDDLNDRQQREHEMALYNATTVPLGETITWKDGTASGSVTPIEDGTGSTGGYCREFRHDVTIDGNAESAYGTACQNADGSWEIVQ